MYLKSIEMQGFKSFADKTQVVFDKGVTAVVGPNGSGKSNITESLRWALGESSAKSLRGGKMPDVIFAGTEVRKALNYAEVAVTLDNSDGFIADAGESIRVERHIYRNGDNDYLIDGRKVRLRDIHDLFLDTGLGRDSFSIISQGKVEEIFNSTTQFHKVGLRLFSMPSQRNAVLFSKRLLVFLNIRHVRKRLKVSSIKLRGILIVWKTLSLSWLVRLSHLKNKQRQLNVTWN